MYTHAPPPTHPPSLTNTNTNTHTLPQPPHPHPQDQAADASLATSPAATAAALTALQAGQAAIKALAMRLGLSDDARDDLVGEALAAYAAPMLGQLKGNFRRVTTPPAELVS